MQKITLINYSNEKYTAAQELQIWSAKEYCKFDNIIKYSHNDLDKSFKEKNKRILNQERGGGYWLWKPYIIQKTLASMQDGEVLVYCDSGLSFKSTFSDFLEDTIDTLNKEKKFIASFQTDFIERTYTKRDVFIVLDCDKSEYQDSEQIGANFSVYIKSKESLDFVNEWLHYASKDNLITDAPNQLGQPNLEGFKDHRHDQSIFSLLSKKNQKNVCILKFDFVKKNTEYIHANNEDIIIRMVHPTDLESKYFNLQKDHNNLKNNKYVKFASYSIFKKILYFIPLILKK